MPEIPGCDRNLVLALNSGSSSLKFGLFERGEGDEQALIEGSAGGIGRPDGSLHIQFSDGTAPVEENHILESQGEALNKVAEVLGERLKTTQLVIGHRIVHGGPYLREHQRLTPEVIDLLKSAVHFAPLHIPQALALITEAQHIFPQAIHFACFDTAFHRNLPPVASHLPLPRRYFDAGVIRYGFHGLSYESLVFRLGNNLGSKAVFAHLGNGSSLCAVRNGRSIDTTMGLTPTGGIPMASRSGDLDPGILLYLLRTESPSVTELEEMLNLRCGLAGFSGGEGDMRALEDRANQNDPDAALAIDAFATAVRKTIGAYTALMDGLDQLVFTGGIGENSESVRQRICAGLEALGITQEKILVIKAEEEKQIARHCRILVSL